MTSGKMLQLIFVQAWSSEWRTMAHNFATYRLWSSNLTTFPPTAATGHKEWVQPAGGTFDTATALGSGPHRKFVGKW